MGVGGEQDLVIAKQLNRNIKYQITCASNHNKLVSYYKFAMKCSRCSNLFVDAVGDQQVDRLDGFGDQQVDWLLNCHANTVS